MSEYEVRDPSTDQVVREYPLITDQQLEDAIARAHGAARTWPAQTTVAERAQVLSRVADEYDRRRDELAEIIVREMGKPVTQAFEEVDFCIDIYRYLARTAQDALANRWLPVPEGEDPALVRKQPVGPVLGIMPWNYPYYQVARFAGPNLVLGNTVLLKHAPQCPESAEVIAEIFQAAGVPEDAYVNVFASNEQIATVIADPRVQGVSLTGSGRAGAAVAQAAGKHLKKVVLELGGADPFVLLGTADMAATVDAAVAGRLDNSGQACNAAKRFVVLDELYDEFCERFTAAMSAVAPGDPRDPGTLLGPLSSRAAAERLDDQVRRAVAGGARVLTSGQNEGAWFSPVVLTDLAPENPSYHEEFFGPVAVVLRARDEEHAVELANDTPYGLSAYVHTQDAEQALRVAERMEAGMVSINGAVTEASELPFGGVKASGFGRELGPGAFDEFANHKLIRVPAALAGDLR